MTNFAKKLVFKLFSPAELQVSNCSGLKVKRPLEKDNRMNIIKSATFMKYLVEDEKKSWVMCTKAMDLAIRHYKNLKA